MVESPRVFFTQEPLIMRNGRPEFRYSLDPARSHGDILFVTKWSDTKLPLNEIIWKARKFLRDNGFSARDYLVPTGDPGIIQAVGAVAAEITDGVIQVMSWNNKGGSYDFRTIDLHCQPPVVR